MFDNRVLDRLFGAKYYEVREELREMHSGELHKFY
jgi:hypothetical protein